VGDTIERHAARETQLIGIELFVDGRSQGHHDFFGDLLDRRVYVALRHRRLRPPKSSWN